MMKLDDVAAPEPELNERDVGRIGEEDGGNGGMSQRGNPRNPGGAKGKGEKKTWGMKGNQRLGPFGRSR
jgi:hypothetical protein